MVRDSILLVTILMVVLTGLLPERTYAQSLDFKSYTVSDGLPHGQIADMTQTSDGIMWIGTAASGLVRFDGHTYTTYGIIKGLKDDFILKTFVDSKNRLWVATYSGGVAVMENDSLRYPFTGEKLDTLYVTTILESPNGHVWFGTFDDSAYIFDGSSLSRYEHADKMVDNTVWDVLWDNDGSIWIGTHKGLSIIREDSVTNYTLSDGLSGSKIFKIIEDSKGTKWMATDRGITTFDGKIFNTITKIGDSQLHYVFDMIKDGSGRIWAGMENTGLYWFDEHEVTHITRNQGLVSNNIHRFFLDNNGNVWVGTDENGISIYRGEGFKFYRNLPGLNTNEILGFHKDSNGIVWIGTNMGLSRSIKADGRFEEITLPDFGTSNMSVWVISEFPNGNLLFLLNNNTLVEYNGRTFSNYSKKIGLEDVYIVDVYFDKKGHLWIATDDGVICYNGSTLQKFMPSHGLAGSVVNHLFESREGEMWIATNLGVSRFDGQRFHNIKLEDGLGHYNVNYITQDVNGDFWFGTSAGVSYYRKNPATDSFSITNFGRQEGMKLVESLFLVFDDLNQLWQGTNGGLHRLNVQRYLETGVMHIEHYKLSRFGLGIETNHDAVLVLDSKHIWFGTMEGIVEIDLKQFRNRPVSNPITNIDMVMFNGVPIDFLLTQLGDATSEEYNGPRTSFDYGNNSLRFQFSGIEYVNPDNLTYRYRLRGFDHDWIYTSTNNFVTYINLPAGSYEFVVQSKVGTDPWSANTATVPILIRSPYWQTAWFWLLVVIAFIVAVTLFIRLRLHFLEKSKLDQLVMEKTATLTRALEEKDVLLKEVHHRVRNNLSIIYGLLELQMENLNDERIKDVFRDSQLRVHSIAMVHEKLYQSDNLSKIDARKYINDLVKGISDSMMESDKQIHVNIDVDDIHLTIDQGIPFGLILNELISNAIKHAFTEAASGIVDVSLKHDGEKTILTVSDNGKGLPEDYRIGTTESIGHVLIEALTRQLKSSVQIFSNPGDTRFEIRFIAA
jgi:two-component sensor histidine kinase/ligand-binding sensor domain-containing protein